MLLFFATAGYTLFYSSFLDITKVEISGLEKLSDGQLRGDVETALSGKYPNGISRRNFIFLDKNALGAGLADKYKRIETISVEKEFPDTLKIAIKERKLLLILCSGDHCYTLNEKWLAYPAENFSSEVLKKENIITLKDLGGAAVVEDTQPLEDDFVQFILDVRNALPKETGVNLTMEYETPNRMSGDLKVETTEGWKIYLSKDMGLENEIFMLKAILDKKINGDQRKDLEYIDLRINDKAFYKFKDGTSSNDAVLNQVQVNDTGTTDPAPVENKDKKKKK